MLNSIKPLFDDISTLSLTRSLGENADTFLSELTFTNFVRVKIMSLAAIVIFSVLWLLDLLLYFDGKWDESAGYSLIALLHSVIILFLAGVQLFCYKKMPGNPSSIETVHKLFTNIGLAFMLLCTVFLAFCNVLTNGSISAYIGMIFAFASIFVMTNVYSIILFGTNMVVMIILLIMVYLKLGRPMDVQIINAAAFTIIAFILSRMLFFHSLKDFRNRLVIGEQAKEINQQVGQKEELIVELRKTLAEVKTLSGLLPICAECKKIRDDKGYWNQLETYIHEHSEAVFSHSICPDCAKKLYPDFPISSGRSKSAKS